MKSEIKTPTPLQPTKSRKPKPKSTPNKPKSTHHKEEKFRITPKGIFYLCLTDTFNIDYDDRRIAIAWELFDTRMHKHGYVKED